MKETVLKFQLDVLSEDREAILADLTAQLSGLNGVRSAKAEAEVCGTMLCVTAEFDSSDAAKKVPRRS